MHSAKNAHHAKPPESKDVNASGDLQCFRDVVKRDRACWTRLDPMNTLWAVDFASESGSKPKPVFRGLTLIERARNPAKQHKGACGTRIAER